MTHYYAWGRQYFNGQRKGHKCRVVGRARARIARRLKAEARVAAAMDQLKARVRDGLL